MGIKKALVSGITGQDGSWLADFLLAKGYKVYGTIRRHSTKESETTRINHLLGNIEVDYCDITDAASVGNLIMKVKPHEVYHLAAMSDVRISFRCFEIYTKCWSHGYSKLPLHVLQGLALERGKGR